MPAASRRTPCRAALPIVLACASFTLALAACQSPAPIDLSGEAADPLIAEQPGAQPAPATPTDAPPAEAITARINLGHPPAALDPVRAAPLDVSASDLVENLFAGLARANNETQRVEPVLARQWEQLPDGLTWYVYLRDDIFWVRITNGAVERVRAITAADVVYAAQRACRADSGAPLGSRPAIFAISGCREVYERDLATLTPEFVAETLGVRVLNDIVVEFKLTADTAIFPTLLALPMLYPVPADLVEAEGAGWTDPAAIWTSGPFVLHPASSEQAGFTLVANTAWPLERPGNVEVVRVGFDTSTEDAFAAWQDGALDLVSIPDGEIPSTPPDADPAYRELAEPASLFLVASYEVPPLSNRDVRHALSLALDRETLIREVLHPAGITALPATTIIPPGTVAAPPYVSGASGFDPAAARAALEQAGYPGCSALPPITLVTDDTFALSSTLARSMVAMWESELGCTDVFTIERQPLFNLYADLQTRPPGTQPRAALIMLGWQADYPDAHHWLADLIGCREFFPAAYLDQARPCVPADERVLDAAALHEDEARAALYAGVVNDLFGPEGEMPVIPLFHIARPLAVQPWLEIGPQQAGPLRFDRWALDRGAQP
jgi:ABC-type oligopeptide transport system substrate-binding subunit